MRKYSFKYLTQRSLRSLVRNGFMSVASILTLSLCLLVIGSFGLLVYNIYVNLNELDGLNEIVCMCDYDLEDGKEKDIEEAIKALNNVESITFISKEEAFAEQIKQYAAFPQILEYFEKTNSSSKDEAEDTTTVAGPEAPKEDSEENDTNDKKVVSDAISKRKNYKSYTYKSIITMKMLGNEIRIDGVERLISGDDGVQFLLESYIGEQLEDAMYYKDGVLYINGESLSCGEISADEFYALDCTELSKMAWLADFSNYDAAQAEENIAVIMNGIMPEAVIKAFDLSSVIPGGKSPEISGDAKVIINPHGDIINESFNLKITVSNADQPFEMEIAYNSEISDINSLASIDFDDEALSEYDKKDDILSLVSHDTSADDETTPDDGDVTDSEAESDVVTEDALDTETAPVTDGETNNGASVRDQNPLSDAFKVVYKDINGITELRDRLSAIDGIRSVKDAADAAQTLQNLKDTIMIIFVGFMLALIFVSVVIIAFTISMAVSTREKEVLVMRYVGATSFFITFPFILESMFIGLIATAISYAIQYGLYGYLCNIMLNSGQEVASFISIAPFSDIWLPTLVAFLAVALLTCYVGCRVTLSKKVKV